MEQTNNSKWTTSEITIKVTLDDNNMIQKLSWDSDDKPADQEKNEELRAFTLSLWDHKQKSTLRMDLWTQEMPVTEMKRMVIDVLSGLSQTIATATNDDIMSHELKKLADKFVEHVKNQN